MNYKAKPLMPLELWDDLPFSMNGRDFATVRREAGRFSNELEERGLLTSVSDDLVLIAELAGYKGRERDFRNLTRSAFSCADVEWIGRIVADVNQTAAGMAAKSDLSGQKLSMGGTPSDRNGKSVS
jgi:hypothetical protein